jgi:hypothetical protein
MPSSVTSGRFLNLEKLPLDRSHAGHEAIELVQEEPLILTSFRNQVGGWAVADSVERICKLRVQKPHVPLQIDELLMQLTLLEHNPISSGTADNLKLQLANRFLQP